MPNSFIGDSSGLMLDKPKPGSSWSGGPTEALKVPQAVFWKDKGLFDRMASLVGYTKGGTPGKLGSDVLPVVDLSELAWDHWMFDGVINVAGTPLTKLLYTVPKGFEAQLEMVGQSTSGTQANYFAIRVPGGAAVTFLQAATAGVWMSYYNRLGLHAGDQLIWVTGTAGQGYDHEVMARGRQRPIGYGQRLVTFSTFDAVV